MLVAASIDKFSAESNRGCTSSGVPPGRNDNGEAWYQVSEPPTKVALADFRHSCERGEGGPGIRYPAENLKVAFGLTVGILIVHACHMYSYAGRKPSPQYM